jgi:polysaccharide export outer membrane protein
MKLNAGVRRTEHRPRRRTVSAGLALSVVWLLAAGAMQAQAPVARPVTPPSQAPVPAPVPVAAPVRPQAQAPAPAVEAGMDYVIGATDVLTIVIWDEKETTSDVTVRPDGKITLPLINDFVAAGLTPTQLRLRITDLEKRFIRMPVVTVIVKQINNNRAFITGQVRTPGPYVLSGPTTVLQLLALAGGFAEFADREHIPITRIEQGVQKAFTFNYDRAIKRQDLSQNIILKAGDTVVVP